MNKVFLIIFLLLLTNSNNVLSQTKTKQMLKKKHVIKPFPKKLAQHAPYYAFKNAVQHKISYHQAYDSLYKN